MRENRPPQLFTVPAGKTSRPCKSACGAPIYLTQLNGKWLPLDCDGDKVPGAHPPTALEHGKGFNHFAVCPQRDVHRKARPERSTDRRPPGQQQELPVDHKARTCIICGCTAEKRCRIPRAQLDVVEVDVQIGRYNAVGPGDLPSIVTCYFYQLEPPICSAPECKAKRMELPLRMRDGVRASEVAR